MSAPALSMNHCAAPGCHLIVPVFLSQFAGIVVSAAAWMFTMRALSDMTTSTTAFTKLSGRSQLAIAKFHIETDRAGSSSEP